MKCSVCKCWLIDDNPEIVEVDNKIVCLPCIEEQEAECCGGCEFDSLCSHEPLACMIFDLHMDTKFTEVGA